MNANSYLKVKTWVWGLFLLVLAALANVGAPPANAQSASEQPVRQINNPETREILEIQAANRTLLRELGARFAATTDTEAAALIAARIQQAKEGLEVRTIEVRIKYAREASDDQKVTLLEGMLKLLQDPEPTPSPASVGTESRTTGEG